MTANAKRIVLLAAKSYFEGEGTTTTTTTQDPPKTFTQDQLNAIVTERLGQERRQWENKNKDAIKKLEELQQQANTTQEQRDTLQQQIDGLKSSFQNKEQSLAGELDTLKKKYNADTSSLTKDRDTWKSEYESNLISVDISQSAVKYKAFNPSQLEAILRPITKVEEVVDVEGKPTGKKKPVVNYPAKDKQGQDIILKLSVDDATKQMTELPDLYGNLFRTEANGGIGGGNTGGRGSNQQFSDDDVARMSQEDYMKHRDKILGQRK